MTILNHQVDFLNSQCMAQAEEHTSMHQATRKAEPAVKVERTAVDLPPLTMPAIAGLAAELDACQDALEARRQVALYIECEEPHATGTKAKVTIEEPRAEGTTRTESGQVKRLLERVLRPGAPLRQQSSVHTYMHAIDAYTHACIHMHT